MLEGVPSVFYVWMRCVFVDEMGMWRARAEMALSGFRGCPN